MSTRDLIRKNISDALDDSALRKSALADEIGVSRAAVSNWLSGRNSVDIELVPEICKFLGITPNMLFGWGDDETETLASAYRSLGADERRELRDFCDFLRCRR